MHVMTHVFVYVTKGMLMYDSFYFLSSVTKRKCGIQPASAQASQSYVIKMTFKH